MNRLCECGDTTTLLVALDGLAGRIVGECHGRQRHQAFLRFLRRLDPAFPGGLMLHVIADNHGVHNREAVRKWLTGQPRFRLHCTPAHWGLVGRPRRELVQRVDAAASSWRLLQRPGTGCGHRRQLDPPRGRHGAVRVEHDRRRRSRQGSAAVEPLPLELVSCLTIGFIQHGASLKSPSPRIPVPIGKNGPRIALATQPSRQDRRAIA